jgi:nitrous oxidase accessory protein
MAVSSSPQLATRSPSHAQAAWRSAIRGPLTAPALCLVGALVSVVAGTLPVWGTRLIAPQYPRGLSLWFYGGRVEGPVTEVNGLNHYIGMQAIDLARVPEMQLWPAAVVGSALLLAVAVLWHGWIGRLALVGLVLVPVGVLVDIQRWLVIFGTELDPTSALRLDPFVPLVIGPSQVWNFTVWGYPGPALILIWVLAPLAWIGRRVPAPGIRGRIAVLVGSVLIATLGAVAFVVPAGPAAAAAPEPDARQVSQDPADLQALVDAAREGATIRVPPGSYRVHLVIERPVTLEADGDVWLDGMGSSTVVTIRASDVTLRGFHVHNTGGQVEEAAAIKVIGGARVRLEQNHFEDFFTGIAASEAEQLRIVGNVFAGSGQVSVGEDHATEVADGSVTAPRDSGASGPLRDSSRGSPPASHHGTAHGHAAHAQGEGPRGQGDAISLWASRRVLVAHNTIGRVRDGVYLNYADDVLVDSNRIAHSRYAVHSMFGADHTLFGNELTDDLSGLVLMYTRGVLAGRNTIVDNRSAGTGFGVVLKDVVGMRLAENVLARNRVGLRAEGTRTGVDVEAAVLRNRFSANTVAVSLAASADLGFGANVFEGNLTDVLALEPGVERQNDWTYQGTGNTWGDYAGFDLDGDDVGDVPHRAGGVEGVVFRANPLLEVYRTSPAMRVLDSAQELWEAAAAPIVTDRAPRVTEHAPPAVPSPDPGDPLPWQVAGGLLVGLPLLARAMVRRQASPPSPSR